MTRRSALCICLRRSRQCADKGDPGGRVQCSASEQPGDGVWLFACFQNHSLRLEVSHMAAQMPAALMHACSSTDCSCQHDPTGSALPRMLASAACEHMLSSAWRSRLAALHCCMPQLLFKVCRKPFTGFMHDLCALCRCVVTSMGSFMTC